VKNETLKKDMLKITCVLLVLCVAGYYQYIRFKHALEVAHDQREDYKVALAHSACGTRDDVRSVEFKGAVLDCRFLRLAVHRSTWEQAFVLWWHTSEWINYWERVTHNLWVVTALSATAIVATIWLGLNACLQARIQDKYERLMTTPQHVYNTTPYLEAPKRDDFGDVKYIRRKTVKL
jgi:hypothetical protein